MIETKRLKIVLLEEGHLELLRLMRNDPTTCRFLTKIDPISQKEQKEWFDKLQGDKSRLYLTIEMLGEEELGGLGILGILGKGIFVGILRSDEWDRVNRSVRIGIDIAKEHRGKGYATEALSAFIDYLFKQQNIHRVWLLVLESNKVAIKLYQKLGFKEEGKQKEAIFRDGKYQNYISMSLLNKKWIK